MIRQNKFPVLNLIKPKHILVSVFDKAGLGELIRGILEVNPEAKFYSTGGTGKEIQKILTQIETENYGTRICKEANYVSVEEFTGAPEMEGGLVKTLHPKIHAGLLAERNNPAHEAYLSMNANGVPAVYFDIFVGNLYPFSAVVAQEGCTAEDARINIDIGGPAMTMAAAKNWHSVAVVTNPAHYTEFVKHLAYLGGTDLEMRFLLMQEATALIGDYRKTIGDHFNALSFVHDVLPTLNIAGGE